MAASHALNLFPADRVLSMMADGVPTDECSTYFFTKINRVIRRVDHQLFEMGGDIFIKTIQDIQFMLTGHDWDGV